MMCSLPETHTLLGGHEGAIKWLSRFLALLPAPPQTPLPLLTAPVLIAFLHGAGHMLANKHPDEFEIHLDTIMNDTIKRLDDGPIGKPSATRLRKFVEGGFSSFKSTLPSRALPELYIGAAPGSGGQHKGAASFPFGGSSSGQAMQDPFAGGQQANFSNNSVQQNTAPRDPFGASSSAPSQPAFGGGGVFGNAAPSPSPFGGNAAPSPAPFVNTAAPSPSPFGSNAAPTPGQFGMAAAPAFGGSAAAASPSPFGGGSAPSPSPFGSPSAQAPSPFGSSAPGPSAFGGGAAPSPSPFGGQAPGPAPINGSGPSPFGSPSVGSFGAAPAPSPFGSNTAPSPSPFGNTGASSSPFGGGGGASSSPFGGGGGMSSSPFGGGGGAISSPSPFGASNGSAAGQGGFNQQSSTFGSSGGDQYRNQSQSTKKPCKFFAEGRCRFGDKCKFSHDTPQGGFGSNNYR
jgi:hypothetical protein